MRKKTAHRKPDKALLAEVTKEMAAPRRAPSVETRMSRPSPPTADNRFGTKRSNGIARHFAYLADIRGVYNRIGHQLSVDPSFVSRVARGERRSNAVLAALEKEKNDLTKQLNNSRK